MSVLSKSLFGLGVCTLALVIVGAFPSVALAQSDVASLVVRVADASGGAVPGATVTVRSTAMGSVREQVSDLTGRAGFPLLAPGTYEVSVVLSGFVPFRDSAVRLSVAQSGDLLVRLDVGGLTEAVDVRGTAPILNLTNAAQGTVITEEKVQALPLNGRQFIQLALLVPGANPGGRAVQQNAVRQNQVGGISINGGRTNNTAFLLDGAINTDPDYNSLNYSPSIDAIAEFQVQTAQFTAEYGRAGGQINVVTKSGGQKLRGSAFEYFRDKQFDEKPFNLVGDLPEFRRHNFGGSLGGQVRPGRVFFFGAYEQLQRREAAAGLTTVTVPTELERRGDFSQSPGGAYDPATLVAGVRQPFPNFQIPQARINPLALAALQAMPLPNSGARSYVNTESRLRQDIYNVSGRVDVNLGPGHLLFARYSLADESAVIPESVPGRDNISDARPQNVVVAWTKVLTARAVNEFRVGVSQLKIDSGLAELEFSVGGQTTPLPRFLPAGYPVMGGAGGFTGTTGGGLVNVNNRTYQIYDNFSYTRGRHTLKAGAEFLWIEYNRTESPNTNGTFQFTTGYTSRTASSDGTGNALASFLLAMPQQGNRSVGPSTIAGRQSAFSLYVQDDWRVNDRLTLNLGLRYELQPPMYDKNGMMASIDYSKVPTPAEIFAEKRTGFYAPTVFVCGQGGTPKGCSSTDTNNLAPRLGVVYKADDRTVLRGGAGLYFAANDANPLFRLAATIPGNIAQTISFNNFVPSRAPGFDIFGPAILGPVQIQQAGIEPDQKTSETYQWSAGVQRELGRRWVLEAGYVGSYARYLEQNQQPNNAQAGSGAVDPRRPYAALEFAAGTVFPSYVTVQGTRVPVGFINYYTRTAEAKYHALVTRLERRFDNGFSLLTAYTLSHATSNAPQFRNAGGVNGAENSPPQDSHNLEAEWGPAYYNAKHRFVTNVTARLPWDFQVAGILTLQSGFPFTVNIRGDTAGVGAGTGGIFVRPNPVPGVSPYLDKSSWKGGNYLNPKAFTTPAAGTFGSVGRNSVTGPGFASVDLVLSRGMALGGTRRLDLRAEVFNALNRRNYTIVGRILNDATFGRLLSQADPRQWQFGARFSF
jgi:outer membrane receptor protein involved in Fe transport